MATNNAVNQSDPFGVTGGGLGTTSLTAHSVLVGNGVATPTQLTVGTSGQLLLGSSGADPAFATPTSGNNSIFFTTGAAALGLRSRLVQQVSATVATTVTCTTIIPADDTIPQNTEGDQVMTVTITPKSSTNILYIYAQLTFGTSTGVARAGIALFQDSTASAIAARQQAARTGATPAFLANLTYIMTAGTTSATTFKIRLGPDSAATLTVNGNGGARFFGGVQIAFINVFEFSNS